MKLLLFIIFQQVLIALPSAAGNFTLQATQVPGKNEAEFAKYFLIDQTESELLLTHHMTFHLAQEPCIRDVDISIVRKLQSFQGKKFTPVSLVGNSLHLRILHNGERFISLGSADLIRDSHGDMWRVPEEKSGQLNDFLEFIFNTVCAKN